MGTEVVARPLRWAAQFRVPFRHGYDGHRGAGSEHHQIACAATLGRKTHYGSHSERGTTVSAIFYTLIETAQMRGLDPAEYLAVATERASREPGRVTLPHDYAAELKAKAAAPTR